jgi:hypothetical protein
MPTAVLTPDQMREIGVFISAGENIALIDKLQKSISEVVNSF